MDTTHYIDLVDGEFKQTNAADMTELFRAFEADSNKDHLVVHFHGGLVGRSSGLGVGENLLSVYKRSGGYPVFFIWNSDLWTAISANLDQIAREEIFARLVRRVTRYVMAKFSESGTGKGAKLELQSWVGIPKDLDGLEAQLSGIRPTGALQPVSELQEQQFESELKNDRILEKQIQEIAADLETPGAIAAQAKSRIPGVAVRCSKKTLMSPTVLKDVAEGKF